jgi:hypothetical protein
MQRRLLSTLTFAIVFLKSSSNASHQNSKVSNYKMKQQLDDNSDGLNGGTIDLWNGSDKEAFYSLEHTGYSLQSDPDTHTGGWHAHRAAWEQVDGKDAPCWVKDEVMSMITKFDYSTLPIGRSPRILVLYGSLRPTSFSRKLAYEFARLLDLLGCDVRIYNPRGLPVRDPALENEVKVQELRALTLWSDGKIRIKQIARILDLMHTLTTLPSQVTCG